MRDDRQRKYLDRGREIALEGRPVVPDWKLLLRLGRRAVKKRRGDAGEFLDEVMWRGVARPRTLRPAVMDYPLMRRWLDVEERDAVAYLRRHWGMVRVPSYRAGALAILDHPGCGAEGYGHRILASRRKQTDRHGIYWSVGFCGDCFQSLLLRYDGRDGTAQDWPFYDQQAA